MLLYLLLLGGCAKKTMVSMARSAFTDENCVKTLETYMRTTGCSDVMTVKRNQELIIRCKKDDKDRSNLWDTYWFRITPEFLKISKDQIAEIERHTVCKDATHRVEAYPPQ